MMKKFSKKFLKQIQSILELKNREEVFSWLKNQTSNIYHKTFTDLPEEKIKSELEFEGWIFV